MALFLAIAGTQVKVPGLAWMLTFLPALMVALFPRWGIRALAGLGASLAVILWFFPPHHLPLSWLGLPDIPLGFHPVVWPFLENGFIFDNWHLFWYLALLAMAFLPLRAFSRPLLPLTILFLTASAFIFFVFFLTDRYRFALDYTQINRAVLHVVPLSAFYVAMLMKGRKGA
ncbi:MAG: hypothetical protein D6819_10120 [Gammaproteobacteria bacterium]|nr:MAG: hypothetical protein D6819_10120 [Gammaproteobacteria bacterium]